MKTTIKIAVIVMMGMSLGINAQQETDAWFKINADNNNGYVASRIFLKSHNDYRGSGIFTLGQTNNWFIGNPYTDHANSFMIGVTNKSEGEQVGAQKKFAKFYLNKDGKVGIGTTRPSAKLDVRNGHLYVGDETFSNPGSWGQTINIDDNVHSRILIEERNTGVKTALWAHTGGNSKVGTISDHDFGIVTKGNTKMTIKRDGKIGIGIESPSSILHIRDERPVVKIQNKNYEDTDNNFYGWIGGYDKSGDEIWWLGEGSSSGKQLGLFTNRAGYDLKIFNKGKGITVKNNGNVGIGTLTTGNHKLAIEGSIGAREIKVEANGWSDFVFYEDYNLPTLTEVENHIKEKGHLKDIPSAKEVEKNGFFLGAMDAKLLQKIEELTLYTIDQQKEIEELKKQNSKIDKQQKEIEELKSLVQKLLKDKN